MRVFTCDFGGVPSAGGGGGSGGAGGCSESLIPLRQFASMLKESMEGSPENPIVIRGAGGYMYGYELYGFCPKGHGGYRYQRLPKHENEMTAEEMDVEIKKMSEVNMCSECGAHFTCAPYHD